MKPILFNTDMVRAILEGRKTVTRRVVKPQPPKDVFTYSESGKFFWSDMECRSELKAPYRPGDILYVKWRPSIHMPREAARIFLRVTDVRVERLQEITEMEAEKEGLRYYDDICQDESWSPTFYDPDSGGDTSTVKGFSCLWDSTIKKADHPLYGWESNPWVWVIEFERISREEAMPHDH